ncbi:MAG: hypothetical protein QNL62_03880 [Gammaproteobacteria bacterium]|nr:hypothetical protein [Gammaproteobacteria bacterium]
MQACEKLHKAFGEYAQKAGISKNPVEFESIKNKVDEIIRLELAKEERIEAWIERGY